jgi:hypothetical protein
VTLLIPLSPPVDTFAPLTPATSEASLSLFSCHFVLPLSLSTRFSRPFFERGKLGSTAVLLMHFFVSTLFLFFSHASLFVFSLLSSSLSPSHL